MSKLYDLLYTMIDRLNKSVKTTAQTLTEAEKTQARANIGAMVSTFAPTAETVGADPKGTAAAAVSAHNTSAASHSDIRNLITGLTNRLNTLANSDDTTLDQMKEIVDYIKANRTLIESVTTNKVNVADIVDNLTTSDAAKPLSAKQGVELLKLINSSSGSGGGMGGADWNAKEGEPGHVLNRTHYTESGMVEVLPETTLELNEGVGSLILNTGLIVGETYTVNWNGTKYECVAQDLSAMEAGAVGLGDLTNFGASGNGEPFLMVGGSTVGALMALDGSAAPIISIYTDSEVVHKLDEKFLPYEAVNVLVVTSTGVDDGVTYASHNANEIIMARLQNKAVLFDWNGIILPLESANGASGEVKFSRLVLSADGSQLVNYYANFAGDATGIDAGTTFINL